MSREEFVRRRRGSDFVGRRGELTEFRANLEREVGSDGFSVLFHVHGIAGVGKSTLARQWDTMARDQFGALTTFVDDDVHSAVEAMAAISDQLGRQEHPLRGFDKLLANYRQRRHEAESAVAGGSANAEGQELSASLSSTVLAQVSLAGLGMVPGLGPLTGAVDAKQMALRADQLLAALGSHFSSRADAELVLSPLRVLTPVFVREIAAVAQHVPWMVLFFDTYEQTGPVLDDWLRELLFENGYGSLPLNVLVVLSGQGRLTPRYWADYLNMIASVQLDIFTEDETRQLLARRGITEERLVAVILELSGRLPVLVDALAQARPGSPRAIGDPADTAVERFLKWIPDPGRRAVVLACALPLQLNEDIYRAAVSGPEPDGYAWLRSLTFVTDLTGRCRYHQVVRSQMLRVLRANSPTQWSGDHTRLARAFERWRQDLETALPANGLWNEDHWRDLRLNQTYHQLCAQPLKALPDALHETTQSCDHGIATLRRWAQTLAQAGHDTGSDTLVQLGRRLQEIAADGSAGVVPALTLILTVPGVTAATRALSHSIRGWEHRGEGNYEAALADYSAALDLDPDLAKALAGRGATHDAMGHLDDALRDLDRAIAIEPADSFALTSRALVLWRLNRFTEALADFNRAVAVEPDHVWSIASRGVAYQSMGRHEEALADFNRAMEINPEYTLAIASRGHTYRLMERYEQALADFDRAIELNPGYAWVRAHRGEVHRIMARWADALDDLDHAIESNPDYTWAIANRGHTYQLVGRHEDALADFDRAIELNPDYTLAIASRGHTHRLMKRYDQALADFDRAIELNPDYTLAIANRGHVYRDMQRYEQALADFDRAIKLNPDYTLAIASRGHTHRLMKRYDQALADFDRAIELNPDYTLAIANRGHVYRDMQRYDQALADLDRAVRLNPDYAWAIANRGHTHRALKRYDQALADFDRALRINPNYAWAMANRGRTYRDMKRYDQALRDLDRALELDPHGGRAVLESAVVLRLQGAPETESEAEVRWQRAVKLFTAEAALDRSDATDQGNLLVSLCGLPDWPLAEGQIEVFLAASPTTHGVREVLADLADLRGVLPVGTDRDRFDAVVRTLEDALARAVATTP